MSVVLSSSWTRHRVDAEHGLSDGDVWRTACGRRFIFARHDRRLVRSEPPAPCSACYR